MKGKKRLEKLFYAQSNALLQFGGVMVLIVPHYVVDPELSGWIASHFDRVTVHLAPEQRFKQVVIMGVRRRSGENAGAAATRGKAERGSRDASTGTSGTVATRALCGACGEISRGDLCLFPDGVAPAGR